MSSNHLLYPLFFKIVKVVLYQFLIKERLELYAMMDLMNKVRKLYAENYMDHPKLLAFNKVNNAIKTIFGLIMWVVTATNYNYRIANTIVYFIIKLTSLGNS